jgi:hypothetical protein
VNDNRSESRKASGALWEFCIIPRGGSTRSLLPFSLPSSFLALALVVREVC